MGGMRTEGHTKKWTNDSHPLTSICGDIKIVGGMREENKDTRRNA